MLKQGPDQNKIEKIIKRAKEYLRMPNPPEVDHAFGNAANDILGKGHLAWGEYKKTAKGIFLSREKEVVDVRHEELLRGVQESRAHKYAEGEKEFEAREEEISELRKSRK